jgi:hypothetical protein
MKNLKSSEKIRERFENDQEKIDSVMRQAL